MIRRPPRSTRKESSAASDVYKRQTYNSVISRWMFDTENRSGTHKATGIELRYCYDNEDGTIRTELVGYPTHVSNLHAQGYSEEEIRATFREIGREFVLICKSLY